MMMMTTTTNAKIERRDESTDESEKGEKSQDRIAIGGASACLPKDANERERDTCGLVFAGEVEERDEMPSQKT